MKNKLIKGVSALSTIGLMALSSVGYSEARLEIDAATACTDLLAGQTIDAGDVCFSVSNNELVVNYSMQNDFELTEAHLWVGNTVDGYPKTKKGNPKIGNFPYNSGDITGSVDYSFTVSLDGITNIDLQNLDQYCPAGASENIYALAHAAVRREDGSGGYQTETGWGDGDKVVDKGSWATRHMITLKVVCDEEPPPPPPERGQETAIMFGDITLNQMGDLCGDNTPARWGWQDGPLHVGQHMREIYAAAGNNVLSNGTHIGYVWIDIHPTFVFVDVNLFEGFEALETHIYVGSNPTCSAAFGKDWSSSNPTDMDTTNGVYVGVHLSAEGDCQDNGNFCVAE